MSQKNVTMTSILASTGGGGGFADPADEQHDLSWIFSGRRAGPDEKQRHQAAAPSLSMRCLLACPTPRAGSWRTSSCWDDTSVFSATIALPPLAARPPPIAGYGWACDVGFASGKMSRPVRAWLYRDGLERLYSNAAALQLNA